MQLSDLGDVITRAELAAVLRMQPRSLDKYATAERRLGRSILPPEVGRARYLKADVEKWLKQGGLSLATTALRRAELRRVR